jgi:hypothetical protein
VNQVLPGVGEDRGDGSPVTRPQRMPLETPEPRKITQKVPIIGYHLICDALASRGRAPRAPAAALGPPSIQRCISRLTSWRALIAKGGSAAQWLHASCRRAPGGSAARVVHRPRRARLPVSSPTPAFAVAGARRPPPSAPPVQRGTQRQQTLARRTACTRRSAWDALWAVVGEGCRPWCVMV